jgi:hypothetical protein
MSRVWKMLTRMFAAKTGDDFKDKLLADLGLKR